MAASSILKLIPKGYDLLKKIIRFLRSMQFGMILLALVIAFGFAMVIALM